jgi:hypothetical protein
MRCCAGDEGSVALRSRPAEGGFDIETGVFRLLRDEPGGYLLTGQVVSGM